MKTEDGFTLVELMIVIAIVAIVAASSLVFPPLLERNTAESYIKEIRSLLVKARNDASNINVPCTVTLAANQITVAMDKNRDGALETTIKNYPQFTINFANANVVFDRRGFTNSNQKVFIDGYSAGATPRVDCIAISASRINIGKYDGANCVQQ